MGSIPTQRTLAWCRKQGMTAAVTERWNPHVRQRQDLFGFIDILYLDGTKTVGVQACRGADTSTRAKKIKASRHAHAWLESPHRMIVVHGWRKLKPRGQKVARWTLREEWIGPGDLLPLPPPEEL